VRKFIAAAVLFACAWHCPAADGNAAAKEARKPAPRVAVRSGEQVVILNQYSIWRTFHLLRPPVIRFDDGPRPLLATQVDWSNRSTAPAPADWTKPEFDDSTWLRGGALAFARTPYAARLYRRARFEVTDPAKVQDLRLSLGYYGGVIVYVNGQELARGNVAKDGPVELAEPYPTDVFVGPGGKVLGGGGAAGEPVKGRQRDLTDVPIPRKLLRKGVNVLAVEVVPAPYPAVLEEKATDKNKKEIKARGTAFNLTWSTCQVRLVKLIAVGTEGVLPNAGRPKGWQAWNSDFLAADFDSDHGDRCEPVRPVAIKGVRNGWFSGKLAVGSTGLIEGLRVTVTDLKQGDSTIPASAVRIRYGASWPGGPGDGSYTTPYWSYQTDALLESPPEANAPGRFGVTVPIWLTLRVPTDAKTGTYVGQLTVSAKGEQTIEVPVTLEVADWTLPDQDDWRTWIELIQSPDTLALEYNVPLWSDRHWELIAQSMRYIGEMGARTVYVPLICHTNFGNDESMVRWIRKDANQYEWDFSIMDKYLDLAQKHMGKLKIVCFGAWEVYLNAPKEAATVTEADKKDPYMYSHKAAVATRWELREKGPAVTVLDRATRKTEMIRLPRYEDPSAKAIWKPLFDELHKRMAKRGLEGSMMLGMLSDIWPTKQEVDVLAEVSGNLPWVNHTHGGSHSGQKVYNSPIGYVAFVWNNVLPKEPDKGRTYGWKRPDLTTEYLRFNALNIQSLSGILHAAELNITGQQRGLGRVGADFWPAIKDKKGARRGYAVDRYPQSFWHSLNLSSHMLVPGPRGPVALARYEVLREGLQECEARIAIERVLTDDALKAKLPPDLARRAQEVLDQRLRYLWRAGSPLRLTGQAYLYATCPITSGEAYGRADAGHYWFLSSGWQDRTQAFYALAGEVERRAGGK